MINALVIAGDSKRFSEEGQIFLHYIRTHLSFASIGFLRTAYITNQELEGWFTGQLGKMDRSLPLLIVYTGHGLENGWGLNDSQQTMLYRSVVAMLNDYSGPILLINDCCYGLAVMHAIEAASQSHQISIIAASSARTLAYGTGRLGHIISDWRERRDFIPGRMITRVCERISIVVSPEDERLASLRERALQRLHEKFPDDFPHDEYMILTGWSDTSDTFTKEIPNPVTVSCERWGASLDHLFYPSQ